MWPFHASSSSNKQLKELRESVERIEHAFKKLEIEWTETYDKFRQLHWRVAKRVKTLEAAEETSGAEQVPGTQAGGGDGMSSSLFTPSQLRANMAVLARRKKGA